MLGTNDSLTCFLFRNRKISSDFFLFTMYVYFYFSLKGESTVSMTSMFCLPHVVGNAVSRIQNLIIYSQISVIRTSIIRNYWVIRRRWTVPTFFPIIYCNKTTNYLNFDYPKNSIFRKIQFFEVICRSRLKKMLLNYPSRFKVQMSRMVIMISLFGRVRFTHLSDLEKKVETGN